MATPLNSWKCLSAPSTRTFSTSSVRNAMPIIKKLSGETKKGQKKSARIKSKPPPKPTGKPPMPGERKAMRKRIVLSNTNAIPVEMKDFGREMTEGREMEEWVGKVVGIGGETVDGLRAAEGFQAAQGWGFFRRPGMLVRKESVEVVGRLVGCEGRKGGLRLLVDGAKETGKSMLLLQAMATAFVRGWIVLHVPDAQELQRGVNDYSPLPDTSPTVWSQPSYTAEWLARIVKANATLLNSITISQTHDLPIPTPPEMTLARLCELGTRDHDIAWPVFQAFWSEITAPGRPPILMSLDNISYIMGQSMYRDPAFNFIHTHDFALTQHFTSYLSGAKTFPNGGAVIAATSRSHGGISRSVDLMVQQQLQRQNGEQITERDPYEKNYDLRAEETLKGFEVLEVGGLSKGEARGLMEYWAASGVLRQRIDERCVAGEWALAGNGVAGEIQRGLRMRV